MNESESVKKNKFPELDQYLSGLFHQGWKDVFDWSGETPNYEGVVRYFKLRNRNRYKEDELKELREFLNLKLENNEIESIVRNDWGIAFRPAYINLTHKQWLEKILKILEEPIEKTEQERIPEFIG